MDFNVEYKRIMGMVKDYKQDEKDQEKQDRSLYVAEKPKMSKEERKAIQEEKLSAREERHREIERMLLDGYSIKSIADAQMCTRTTIYKVADKKGIEIFTKEGHSYVVPLLEKIYNLYKENKMDKEIALILNIPYRNCERYINFLDSMSHKKKKETKSYEEITDFSEIGFSLEEVYEYIKLVEQGLRSREIVERMGKNKTLITKCKSLIAAKGIALKRGELKYTNEILKYEKQKELEKLREKEKDISSIDNVDSEVKGQVVKLLQKGYEDYEILEKFNIDISALDIIKEQCQKYGIKI